jgi:hypothetical protein
MATTSNMFMYSLTIQPPTAITQAILGQFAGTKEQQIVTASGSKLTIHRPDPTQGKITPIYSQDVFGIIRTLAAFRLAGSSKGMFDILPPRPYRRTNLVIRQASRAARSLSAKPTLLEAGRAPVGVADTGCCL